MAYLPQLSFQPYVKPYAGSTNPELADTLKVLGNRYDENLKASTDLDILAGQTEAQVIEGDRPLVQGRIQQVRDGLRQIAETDTSYYTARPKIAGLASQFAGDPDILKMKENKALYDKEQAVKNQMIAQGIKVLDFGNKNFQTISVDENGNKIYNTYQPATEQMHNYHEAQSRFFDQMQADAGSGGLSRAAIAGFLQTGSWQGISGKKIQLQAQRALSNYLNTPEGDQQLRYYTQLRGLNPDQARNNILKEMISTGMERSFSQSETRYVQDPMALIQERARTKGRNTDDEGNTRMLQADGVSKAANTEDVNRVVKYLTQPAPGKTNKSILDYITPTGAMANPTNNRRLPYQNLTEDQKQIFRNALTQAKANLGKGASKMDLTNETLRMVKELGSKEVANTYYSLTGTTDVNSANNTFKNGNFNSLLYIDPENPGKTLTWKQLKDKFDLEDEDDKAISKVNVSGYYTTGNTFTRGLKGELKDRFVNPTRLTVQDKDGNTRTVVASSDLGAIKSDSFVYDKLISDIYEGNNSGRGYSIRLDDGKRYTVTPTGRESSAAIGDEVLILTDEDGNQKELTASLLLLQRK